MILVDVLIISHEISHDFIINQYDILMKIFIHT